MGQTALYSNLPIRLLKFANYRKGAYKAIDWTAVLDQVMWQGSNNTESFAFKTALMELHNDFISNST